MLKLKSFVSWEDSYTPKPFIRVRLPGKSYLSFEERIDDVSFVLEELRTGITPENLKSFTGPRRKIATLLIERGFVSVGTDSPNLNVQLLRFWHETRESDELARYKLHADPAEIDIEGDSPIVERVREIVQECSDSNATPSIKRTPLRLLCLSSVDDNRAAEFNRSSLTQQVPYAFIMLDGTQFTIGPLVIPGSTGCFECYLSHSRAISENRSKQPAQISRVVPAKLDHFPSMLDCYLVPFIFGLLHGSDEVAPPGVIRIWDAVTAQSDSSRVFRMARCPACDSQIDKPLRASRAVGY